MENGKKPAFPLGQAENFRWSDGVDLGLTKREYFAGLAMQGYLNERHSLDNKKLAEWSVKMADALLAELDKNNL
jgi:hypothetical protein